MSILFSLVLFLSFSFGCGPEEVMNEEGNYKDGKLDGLSTDWYEGGQKKSKINYKGEMKDGLSTYWFERGSGLLTLKMEEYGMKRTTKMDKNMVSLFTMVMETIIPFTKYI